MPGSFFDTNVLVYIASDDLGKADRAHELVRSGGSISVQVLNELANVARRKMALSWTETHAFLSAVRGLLTVHPLTAETHDLALMLAERYRLSIYDAAIAAAATEAGCDLLWSEDMHDGLVLPGAMRVVNPFRGLSGC